MNRLAIILTVLTSLLLSFSPDCYGQDDQVNTFQLREVKSHFEFKGIEIDGPLFSFCQELETKGFDLYYVKSDGRGAALSGTFTNKPVNLFVLASSESKTVFQVIVEYEQKENWYDLKSNYKDLKSQLTRKYGEPESYEFFSFPFEQGDGKEMAALWADKCTYSSFFVYKPLDADLGRISLSIEKSGVYGRVVLKYEDVGNFEKMRAEASANILE